MAYTRRIAACNPNMPMPPPDEPCGAAPALIHVALLVLVSAASGGCIVIQVPMDEGAPGCIDGSNGPCGAVDELRGRGADAGSSQPDAAGHDDAGVHEDAHEEPTADSWREGSGTDAQETVTAAARPPVISQVHIGANFNKRPDNIDFQYLERSEVQWVRATLNFPDYIDLARSRVRRAKLRKDPGIAKLREARARLPDRARVSLGSR